MLDILPPSPPTTSSRQRSALESAFSVINSRPDSPPVPIQSSSEGLRKRVEFSTSTSFHDPQLFTPSSADVNVFKTLPPSRECQVAAKSILKPYQEPQQPSCAVDGSQDTKLSSDEMIESIIHQLSCGDRATKIDAYATFVSLIKTYDEVPEASVLKRKLGVITKCIRRDLISMDNPETGSAEGNLVTHALKALVVLVWSREFAPFLTDEYRLFVLDRSIQVLHERKAPKSVMIHYLHLLATQDFRSSLVLSNSRALRLLDELSSLTDQYSGNGVTSQRLMVYLRLLEQARSPMLSRALPWLHELTMALVSSLRDTRVRAITLGTKACLAFPTSPQIAFTMREVLNQETPGGRPVGNYICKRLEKLAITKEDSAQAPQIWAIILLLLGGSLEPIEQWPYFRDLLKVMQRTFNCSDPATRFQANLAWNRLVSVSRPHEATDDTAILFVKPILAQLDRESSGKQNPRSRVHAISSYCNLLYYAFRPTTTQKDNSRTWNAYLVRVMTSKFLGSSVANADLSCRILMALLWKGASAAKPWNVFRAYENAAITPEELPTIDCRWIRAHTESILKLFDIVFRHSSWGPDSSSDQAYVAQAWIHFTKALAESSCREIKPTNETRAAVCAILRFLRQLEADGDQTRLNAETPLQFSWRLKSLFRISMCQIGMNTFLDIAESSDVIIGCELSEEIIKHSLFPFKETDALHTKTISPTDHIAMEKVLCVLNHDLKIAYLSNSSQGERLFSTPLSDVLIVMSSLPDMPMEVLKFCLQNLQESLSVWVRDADRRLPQDHMLAFWTAQTLSKVESADLYTFDGLFAACFSSTRTFVLDVIVDMWKRDWEPREDLSYPPQLEDALQNLLSLTDLKLPRFVKDDSLESSPQPGCGHDDRVVGLQAQPQTPLTRPRHDDSQVQFVPIESSPPNCDYIESQVLTNRQKDVRNRQRAEATATPFFSDVRYGANSLRSPSHSTGMTPERVVTIDGAPSTPDIPSNVDDIDVGFSPTPKAKQQALRLEDIEVTSSPPGAEKNGQNVLSVYEPQSSVQPASDDIALLQEPPASLFTEELPLSPSAQDLPDDLFEDEIPSKACNATPDEFFSAPDEVRQGEDSLVIQSDELEQLNIGRTFPEDTNPDQHICDLRASEDVQHLPDVEIDLGHGQDENGSPPAFERCIAQEKISRRERSQILTNERSIEVLQDETVSELASVEKEEIHPTEAKDRNDSHELSTRVPSHVSPDLDMCIVKEKDESHIPPASTKRECHDTPIDRPGKRPKRSAQNFCVAIPPLTEDAVLALGSEDDVQDTIVVNLTKRSGPLPLGYHLWRSESQSSNSSGSQVAKRSRRRPRKSTTPTCSQEIPDVNLASSHPPKAEELDESDDGSQRASSSGYAENVQSGAGEGAVSAPSSRRIRSHVGWRNDAGESDIATALRQVLSRLKCATPDQVDLREIHDLCFDIRTEAQNALQRGSPK